jgi:hypothetical protein
MAIQTEGLLMALVTVAGTTRRRQTMPPLPGGIMIGRNPLARMAVIAFGNFHGAIVFVSFLLGESLGNGEHGHGHEQG